MNFSVVYTMPKSNGMKEIRVVEWISAQERAEIPKEGTIVHVESMDR